MAKIKYRELKTIHTENITPGTEQTFIAIYNTNENINVINSNFEYYGCCTNTAHYRNEHNERCSSGTNDQLSVMKLTPSTIPSKYRTKKFIQQWFDFINQTFPWCDIKIVCMQDGKILDKQYWTDKNITFNLEKEFIYVSFTRVYKNKGFNHYKQNLLTISYIRYLVETKYFFQPYDILRLRKLKSLKDLNNLEIMNICRYNIQSIEPNGLELLYYYRSPHNLDTNHPDMCTDIEVITDYISKHNYLNDSFSKNRITINVWYLISLFQNKQYLKIHKLTTDSKYFIDINDSNYSINFSNSLKKIREFQSNYSKSDYITEINDFNKLNIKQYEKQL